MSMSNVARADPRAAAARPPTTTKSTSWRMSSSSSGLGLNSAPATSCALELADEVRERDHEVQPLLRSPLQVLLDQRLVDPVVDRLRVEGELLAHQVEQLGQRRH